MGSRHQQSQSRRRRRRAASPEGQRAGEDSRSRRRRHRVRSRGSRHRVSLQSGSEPEAFSLQPASEQRRLVDSQERQEYGTVRESAWHARVR
jgi:hypothetical protein